MKTGILINPTLRTVQTVELSNDYRDIYKHIEADLFDIIRMDRHNDLYIDDEGIITANEQTRFFMIAGYPHPLAGNALILGNTPDGESTSTTLTVEEITNRVCFQRLIFISSED